MKILLAIDQSRCSQAALQAVVDQYRPRETEVLVLHVLLPVESIVPPDLSLESLPDWGKFRARQLRAARRLVGKAKETLSNAGFRAESEVAEGNPRAEIVDRASEWNADLIVIGSHGLTGFSRLLLGSVSEYVVRHATCSVEVIRAPKLEEPALR
jgi:nucleotide-binding universal stress UspA family protein